MAYGFSGRTRQRRFRVALAADNAAYPPKLLTFPAGYAETSSISSCAQFSCPPCRIAQMPLTSVPTWFCARITIWIGTEPCRPALSIFLATFSSSQIGCLFSIHALMPPRADWGFPTDLHASGGLIINDRMAKSLWLTVK